MSCGHAQRTAGLFRPDRQHRRAGAELVDVAGDPYHRTGDRIPRGGHDPGERGDQADPEARGTARHCRQDGGVRNTLGVVARSNPAHCLLLAISWMSGSKNCRNVMSHAKFFALYARAFQLIYKQVSPRGGQWKHKSLRRKNMLDGLRQFIAEVVAPQNSQGRFFDDTGYRMAATALLIHIISLDGEPSDREKRKLHSLVESQFGLDPGTADKLIASATLVEGEAVDLYHFTSVIMREVDEAGRLRIVEMMWELVYADGQVSEFEDNVVWRAADLLAVSSRDRIELKHRVADRRSASVGGE